MIIEYESRSSFWNVLHKFIMNQVWCTYPIPTHLYRIQGILNECFSRVGPVFWVLITLISFFFVTTVYARHNSLEESNRSLNSNLVFDLNIKCGSLCSLGSRGESSSRCNKSGKDSKLHFEELYYICADTLVEV